MEVEALVTPGARKEKVVERKKGVFEIAVREDATRNEANVRVRAIIAHMCKVPLARVRMVRGARSRKKFFKISA